MNKGIILAGGKGTRLSPLTDHIGKALLPIYDKPLIYYPLSTLMLANIRDILIITTERDLVSFESLLGDGNRWGIYIDYKIQKEPKGIAEAFIIAEDFIHDDPVCLILGDNIFYGQSLSALINNAINDRDNAIVVANEVADPERYGVAEFDGSNVVSIEEKPKNPKSNWAVTGLYFYPNDVVDIAKNLKPSDRGELEITDVNKEYLKYNRLKCLKMGRGSAWLDAGTFESMLDASNFIHTIEKRHWHSVACLEEIAFNNGFIDKDKLLFLAEDYPNEYGEYIKRIADR